MSLKIINELFESDKKYNELISNILSSFKEIPKNVTLFFILKKDIDKYTVSIKFVKKDFLKDIGKNNENISNYIPLYDEEIFEEYFVEEVNALNYFMNDSINFKNNKDARYIFNTLKKYMLNEIKNINDEKVLKTDYFKERKPKKLAYLEILKMYLKDLFHCLEYDLYEYYQKILKFDDFNDIVLNEKKFIIFDDVIPLPVDYSISPKDEHKKIVLEFLTIKNYAKVKMLEINFLLYYYSDFF